MLSFWRAASGRPQTTSHAAVAPTLTSSPTEAASATRPASNAANQSENKSTSAATLKLTPITLTECRERLEHKGISISEPQLSDYLSSQLKEHDNIPRNTVILKLCDGLTNSADILDIDDDVVIQNNSNNAQNRSSLSHPVTVTRYARRFHDGSIAAMSLMGRNETTGIKCLVVSRALCDVSLARQSVDKRRGEVHFLDGSSDELLDVGNSENARDEGDRNWSASVQACLTMRYPPGKHVLYLDGRLVNNPMGRQIPLNDGSILSLHGPTGTAYQIQIDEHHTEEEETTQNVARLKFSRKDSPSDGNDESDSSSTNAKKRKAVTHPPSIESSDKKIPASSKSKEQQAESISTKPEPSPHKKIRQREQELIIGECICAVCRGILVKSTFSYPCGHPFCAECADNITRNAAALQHAVFAGTAYGSIFHTNSDAPPNKGKCPVCRGQVEAWMPVHSFDAMVWSMALLGSFERDDAERYLERRELSGQIPLTNQERECILNGGDD